MGKLFGTDGVRGIAGTELSCELAMELGRAAAYCLTRHVHNRPRVIIGKDTRISSDMLECALTAGLCSVGADVEFLGVVPTPAVAYLVGAYQADMGVMISASHNPVEYNGIKLFSKDGYKLSDQLEEEIEQLLGMAEKPYELKTGGDLGRVSRKEGAVADYVSHLLSTLPGDLSGLKVAVDCANGSASATAKELFARCGVEAVFLHCRPDGCNINRDCGSTHMDSLRQAVREGDFDAGIAYDGDADRCLMVDHRGELVDGDQILAVLGNHLMAQGKLPQGAVVVTVLSNMGLSAFCAQRGMRTVATKVGDRYVLEEMLSKGYGLGGEQSGHTILLEHATTGDGQLTSLQVLWVLRQSGKTLAQLAGEMEKYPQAAVNVRATPEQKQAFSQDRQAEEVIARWEQTLEGQGRVIVRVSGTEPVIRVLAEGKDGEKTRQAAQGLAAWIEERYQR